MGAPAAGISVVIDGKRVSFNAAGYRGRELALPKARDRTRVVVLGDSIAFGLDVSDDETFTHLLDARDNGIEAANLAVQGYGPDQELIVLLDKGLRLDPDVVVLAFCLGNDLRGGDAVGLTLRRQDTEAAVSARRRSPRPRRLEPAPSRLAASASSGSTTTHSCTTV